MLMKNFASRAASYQDVTGYRLSPLRTIFGLTGRGESKPATGIEVIGNFFQVLGVQPAMGRLFTADEARGGPHPVASADAMPTGGGNLMPTRRRGQGVRSEWHADDDCGRVA